MKYTVYLLPMIWAILQTQQTEMTDSMTGTRQMIVACNLPAGGHSCIRHCRRLRSQSWKGIEIYTADELIVTVAAVPVLIVAVTQ
jgi:hypothetical protein